MKVIVYQGWSELFAVRVVTDDGSTLFTHPAYFLTQEEAIAQADEYVDRMSATLEVRPTIADVAAEQLAGAEG